jgi:anti-sigma factor RsiW
VIDPRDMVCRELVERLTDYLDGTLDPYNRARLEAHLAVCDGCREYLAQFRATIALAGRTDPGVLCPALRSGLLHAFRAAL